MARYRGPVCRLCRRENTKLFLKGDRCNSHKCSMEKKPVVPGQHGMNRRMKPSEYGLQLREKQKAKRLYAILEKQFRRYFKLAEKMTGMTGENLFVLIERRLDNVVYRSGLSKSRVLARQLIIHGHFFVNGRRVDRPSYRLKENDIINVNKNSKEIQVFKDLIDNKETAPVPLWIESSLKNLEAKVIRLPKREDINIPVNEQLIVELYSK